MLLFGQGNKRFKLLLLLLAAVVFWRRRKWWANVVNDDMLKPPSTISKASNASTATTTFNSSTTNAVLAGMVMDVDSIQPTVWRLLQDLSCQYQVPIHIVSKQQQQNENSHDAFCTRIFVEQEDVFFKGSKKSPHWLLRLAQIRDAQRNRVRELFFHGNDETTLPEKEALVIVLDLDLYKFPSAEQIMQRVHDMRGRRVVCGFGNWLNQPKENGIENHLISNNNNSVFYYDNYALVLWPDTFAWPVDIRYFGDQHYATENTSIIPPLRPPYQDNRYPAKRVNWAPYLKKLAQQDPDGLAPVRSCFAGMALYDAAAWLTPKCHYNVETMLIEEKERKAKLTAEQKDMQDPNHIPLRVDFKRNSRGQRVEVDSHSLATNLMRYAAAFSRLPCEHVVFHDCLHRVVFRNQSKAAASAFSSSPVAVDPQLLSQWIHHRGG